MLRHPPWLEAVGKLMGLKLEVDSPQNWGGFVCRCSFETKS